MDLLLVMLITYLAGYLVGSSAARRDIRKTAAKLDKALGRRHRNW